MKWFRDFKKWFSLTLASLGLVCYSLPRAEDWEPSVQTEAELQGLVDDVRNATGIPGLSAAIVYQDRIIAASSGLLQVGQAENLTVHHRMHLGSVSKGFTALLIAILVRQGHLRYNMTLSEALPEMTLDEGFRSVTIHDLLTNQAGLIGFHNPEFEDSSDLTYLDQTLPSSFYDPAIQRLEMARKLLGRPPLYPARSRALYSNPAWAILGLIAEQNAGMQYESLLEKALFGPLSMESARTGGWPASAKTPDQPRGHYLKEGSYEPQPLDDSYGLRPWMNPAGGIHMSILDFARYAREVLRGLNGRSDLLPAQDMQNLHSIQIRARISEMYQGAESDQLVGYGYGWGILETSRGNISAGEGSAGTFYASIFVFPYLDIAIVSFTNCGNREASAQLISKITGIPWG
ncbi:MAG: beta-lactamase family protein [Leptospiraceae bacterium]|nr:beta-lactamase family protein [Leptospiraceae bacterium]